MEAEAVISSMAPKLVCNRSQPWYGKAWPRRFTPTLGQQRDPPPSYPARLVWPRATDRDRVAAPRRDVSQGLLGELSKPALLLGGK
jgi:hypothetical protein